MKKLFTLLVALAMTCSLAAQPNMLTLNIGIDSINLTTRKAYVSIWATKQYMTSYTGLNHFTIHLGYNPAILSNPVLHNSPSPSPSNLFVNEIQNGGTTYALIENDFTQSYGMTTVPQGPKHLLSVRLDINPSASPTDSLILELPFAQVNQSPTQPWITTRVNMPHTILSFCPDPRCTPIALNDTAYTVSNGQSISFGSIFDNDTSPGSLPLSVIPISYMSSGSSAINPNGTVYFAPTPNFVGYAYQSVLISNPFFQMDTSWIYINVLPDTLSSTQVVDYSPLVQVFPNPTNKVLNIQNHSPLHFDRFRIYNSQGILLCDEPFNSNIDCSGLSSGLYIITLKSQERELRKVFVKQ
jgi:hypothetical protein